MKLKSTLLAVGLLAAAATAAQAGPQISISIGGGCAPRPVYYAPAPVCAPVVYAPRVVYDQPSPVFYSNPGWSNRRVVQYGPPVYRVAAPVCGVPVRTYPRNTFYWRN